MNKIERRTHMLVRGWVRQVVDGVLCANSQDGQLTKIWAIRSWSRFMGNSPGRASGVGPLNGPDMPTWAIGATTALVVLATAFLAVEVGGNCL